MFKHFIFDIEHRYTTVYGCVRRQFISANIN